MHIAVTGSSGLLGSALVSFLAGGGHRLTRLVRSPATAGAAEIEWHPQAGRLEPNSLEGLDGFVHLAGENIASRTLDRPTKGPHSGQPDQLNPTAE